MATKTLPNLAAQMAEMQAKLAALQAENDALKSNGPRCELVPPKDGKGPYGVSFVSGVSRPIFAREKTWRAILANAGVITKFLDDNRDKLALS